MTSKNILPYPYANGTEKTINGITYSVQSDGTIICNGTATSTSKYSLTGTVLLQNYVGCVLSGGYSQGTSSTYWVGLNASGVGDSGSGLYITQKHVNNHETDNFVIRIASGYTANNLIIKPQIEKGTTATEYEPYSAVEDTFDINTQTLTRNVGKYEFTGSEAGWDEYNKESEGVSFVYNALVDKEIGYKTSICSHFKNYDGAWGSKHIDTTGLYSDHNKYVYQYFRAPNGRSDIDSLDEWKVWLAEQYANGTPVTVWFQLATPTTETILSSKNLYQGNQRLKYKTGASDNNINQPATITITQNAEYSFDNNPGSKELGGDLFDMMFNNPTVLSYKLKRNTDDVITNSRVSVNFMNGSNSLGNIHAFYNAYDNDEEYHLIYIAIPKLSELTYSSTVDKVHINFADYSKVTSRDFIIKDIQIEVGSVPTDFERYDPTEYKRVNGVVLRQIGDVKDTYTASTKKITRLVREFELTGDESWIENYKPTILINLSSANFGLSQKDANSTVICSHAPSSSSTSNFGAKMTNDGGGAIGFAQCYSGFGVEDLTGFKNYLKDEYAKGNPVTMWYVLKTATTETLS